MVRPYDAFLSDARAEAAAGKVVLFDTAKVSTAVYKVRAHAYMQTHACTHIHAHAR